jgi:hypothetical protein
VRAGCTSGSRSLSVWRKGGESLLSAQDSGNRELVAYLRSVLLPGMSQDGRGTGQGYCLGVLRPICELPPCRAFWRKSAEVGSVRPIGSYWFYNSLVPLTSRPPSPQVLGLALFFPVATVTSSIEVGLIFGFWWPLTRWPVFLAG